MPTNPTRISKRAFSVQVVCLFRSSVKLIFPSWEQRLIQSSFCSQFKWFGSNTGPLETETVGQSLRIIKLRMAHASKSKRIQNLISLEVIFQAIGDISIGRKVSAKIKSYKRHRLTTYALQACQNK